MGRVSQQKLLLDLFLGNQLAGFGLRTPLFDLREEAETLDRVLERGIVRKVSKSLDRDLFFGFPGHRFRISTTQERGRRRKPAPQTILRVGEVGKAWLRKKLTPSS